MAGRELQRRLSASPPIRSMFERDDSSVGLRATMGPKDDVIWAVGELVKQDSPCPREIVAAELNRLVQLDKRNRDRATPLVTRFVSHYSLLHELRTQLRLFCPKLFLTEGRGLEMAVQEKQQYADWATEWVLPIHHFMKICAPAHARDKFLRLGKYGDPTSGMLDYPVDKKGNKDTTESMQAAERNLDTLWSLQDCHLRTHLDEKTYRTVQSILPNRGELHRTADWVEPEKAPRKPKVDISAVNLDFGEDSSTVIPIRIPEPKVKVKTKGESLQAEADTESTQSEVPQQMKLFTVKKRAFRVFSTLFYRPSANEQPGELSWAEFLHAMNAIGFVPEKLYGSVWRFAPGDIATFGVDHAMNFHEPHPSGKLPFRVARRYGRRLNRTYGLDGLSFALKIDD